MTNCFYCDKPIPKPEIKYNGLGMPLHEECENKWLESIKNRTLLGIKRTRCEK